MSKIPKQLLWILDYEDSLRTGNQLPTNNGNNDERNWLKQHERLLNTQKKRDKMKKLYAPREDDKPLKINRKPIQNVKLKKYKRVRRKCQKEQPDNDLALYVNFQLAWGTALKMDFPKKDRMQIIKNYRKKGLEWKLIEKETRLSRYALADQGVTS